jgi:hypothetical protein
MAGRPAEALTRRDVARALLAVPSADALAELPGLRRQLLAAGNPLSAAFWDSADATLKKIADDSATVGDVRTWLESTGTEPAGMIGMLVWGDEGERGPQQTEIHGLLVAHLERLLADGVIDPDRLAAADPVALRGHHRLQEEWMMAPLPDGRIPMWTVTDEEDDEFLAEWDAAEAEALAELREILAELPARELPEKDLHSACDQIRAAMQRPGWPRELLAACAGVDPDRLPGDDAELWLALAAGIVSPREELRREGEGDDEPDEPGESDDLDDELDELDEFGDESDELADLTEDEQAMVALCALDLNDWLAATSALARGGPGTRASDLDLARYVSDYDPDDFDDQSDAAAGMFAYAVGLWRVLGAVDDADRLTPLGWWGLPEAVQRAWTPRE